MSGNYAYLTKHRAGLGWQIRSKTERWRPRDVLAKAPLELL